MFKDDYVGDNEDRFQRIVDRRAKRGVLTDIALIVCWVLPTYLVYFNNALEISVLRTTDVVLWLVVVARPSSFAGAS